MQSLLNIVDGVEQTCLNPKFFPGWFLLNVVLRYQGDTQRFSYWQIRSIFLEDFHAYIASVESLHWVSDCSSKTLN